MNADRRGGRRRDPEKKRQEGRPEDADDDRAGNPPDYQQDDHEEPEEGQQGGRLAEVAKAQGRTRDAEADQTGFIAADECEQQPDPDRKPELERLWQGLGKPAPDSEDREEREEDTGDEDGAQRNLPGVPHDLDHRKCDEGVLPHVGGNGEWAAGVQSHHHRSEHGGQDRGHHRGASGNAGGLQDGGIDDDDVGHRKKRRDPGKDFLPVGGSMPVEFEKFFHLRYLPHGFLYTRTIFPAGERVLPNGRPASPTGPKQSNYAIFILWDARPAPPVNAETGGW